MDEVTAYIREYKHGQLVNILTYHVRANWDEGMGGLTADIYVEDHTGKRHAVPEREVKATLKEIRELDKEAWDEINERAQADDLEGCDEDFDTYDIGGVYAA